MKTTLKALFAVTFFISALTAVIVASPSGLFSIENKTSFPVGPVTLINNSGVATTVDVPATGTFSANISGGVSGARINNQNIQKGGQTTNIILGSGFVVQVALTGNQIVVTDQSIVSGEKNHHSR